MTELETLTNEEIIAVRKLLKNGWPLTDAVGLTMSVGKMPIIAKEVCLFYEIPLMHFLSAKREKHLVNARTDFCHLANKLTNLSLTVIGRFLKRDHTTVIHHLKKQPINADKIESSICF
jgi:chromosomal replication initiation ATPase DnaA